MIYMFIPLIFLLSAVALLIYLINSFIILCKTKKELKYFFKKPLRVKDIVQIILIVIFSVILVLEIAFIVFVGEIPNRSHSGVCGEYRTYYKKAISGVYQALTLHKTLTGEIKYDNVNDFAKIFLLRMSVLGNSVKYIQDEDLGYQTYSEKQLKDKELNIAEYENKPTFTTADGMMFVITKFENGCKNVDTNITENNDCLMDIDANNLKLPNKKTENYKRPSDRITVIINGNNDTIIPDVISAPIIYDEIPNEQGTN